MLRSGTFCERGVLYVGLAGLRWGVGNSCIVWARGGVEEGRDGPTSQQDGCGGQVAHGSIHSYCGVCAAGLKCLVLLLQQESTI